MAMDRKKLKKNLKKTWHFIWEDDSIWSWLVNIILAFVLIKFIVYPSLGFLLNTTHPIVAVVSGSMEHKIAKEHGAFLLCGKSFEKKGNVNFDFFWDSCGQWYEQEVIGITKEEFKKFDLFSIDIFQFL